MEHSDVIIGQGGAGTNLANLFINSGVASGGISTLGFARNGSVESSFRNDTGNNLLLNIPSTSFVLQAALTTFATFAASGIVLASGTGLAMGANKITGLANGTASTDAAAFGQIQILQTVTATSNTAFSTSSATFQSTNLTATITPTSASNRILILVSGMLSSATPITSDALLTIFRDSTNLGGGIETAFVILETGGSVQTADGVAVTFVDSPATTSATTYTVKIFSDGGTSVSFGLNNLTQSMVLMEVV